MFAQIYVLACMAESIKFLNHSILYRYLYEVHGTAICEFSVF